MTGGSVGFVGAGLMGAGMASCLLNAGHPVSVLVHNNRAPIAPLLARGADEAADLKALVDRSDVIVTCLPNADIVERLASDILPNMRAGQIWIDTTTSRPATSETLAERVAECAAIFADAPVTGGPQQAMEGALASLVGCEEAAFPQIYALVSLYSKTVQRFGGPGCGHAAKLLNNLVTQGTTLLLADAFQTAQRMGVDQRALYDVMMTGAARSGTLQKAVGPALDGNYDGAAFTIANAAKDLRYARDLLSDVQPERAALAALLAERLAGLERDGHGADFVSTMLKPTDP